MKNPTSSVVRNPTPPKNLRLRNPALKEIFVGKSCDIFPMFEKPEVASNCMLWAAE